MGDQAHVVVYEKNGVKRGIDFRPFPGEYGGVDVAAGDFNGDGKDEVVAANFTGSNSKIIVYKYNTAREIYATVTPFGSASVGATVAAGDVDKDGKAELIVGASVGGAPRVIVYDVKKNKMIKKPIEFMAFAPSSRSGVDVSSGDFDNDGKDEIVVSQLFYAEARVKVYRYNSQKTILGNFLAYPAGIQCGANVDAFDIDSDDKAEVLTGPNMPGAAQIRAFEKNGTSLANVNFFAYARSLKSGASVVGGWF
ncbi:MAG: hypothetical protein ACD_63C00191G0002 [uncultured bacterium]|nr:MAG: hypothetical protein ACD_63C00191G0002 [uncultured bacterium]